MSHYAGLLSSLAELEPSLGCSCWSTGVLVFLSSFPPLRSAFGVHCLRQADYGAAVKSANDHWWLFLGFEEISAAQSFKPRGISME